MSKAHVYDNMDVSSILGIKAIWRNLRSHPRIPVDVTIRYISNIIKVGEIKNCDALLLLIVTQIITTDTSKCLYCFK
jgi:hypothetical protein